MGKKCEDIRISVCKLILKIRKLAICKNFSSVSSHKISTMRKLFFAVCLSLLVYSLPTQQFGGNPPSVKWKQINTDTARIIFPTGLDSQANRVASIVHYLQKEKPVSLGDKF